MDPSGPPHDSEQPTPRPTISILVATKDRPHDLDRLLPTVLAQDAPDFELIIVDQSTTDETSLVVAKYADPRVAYVRHSAVGKSKALNLALSRARADIFAFTDDDCTLPADWLSRGARLFSELPTVSLAFGSLVPIEHDPTSHFVPAIIFDRRRIIRGRPWISRGLLGMGANMFATRRLFATVGGFDEDLGPGGRLRTGEECELTYRALKDGQAVIQEPGLTVTHWGARPFAGGVARRLVTDGFFAIGAGYGKHARSGRIEAVAVMLHETVRAARATARAAASGRRPLHLRRSAALWRGFSAGVARGAHSRAVLPDD